MDKIESPFAVLNAKGPQNISIERILNKCSRDASGGKTVGSIKGKHVWSAEYFRLNQSSDFEALSESQKLCVLQDCTRQILEEALMIEIAGMSFTARMSLGAESLSQRELYSHFASDEANHFRMIRKLIGEPDIRIFNENPFIAFLARLIEMETRLPLVLMIQVILEGWGISYYSGLADHATEAEVASILKHIVSDESKHHGSGLVLFEETKLGLDEFERLEAWMKELLFFLRLGPAGIIGSLSRQINGTDVLDFHRIENFLSETQYQVKLSSDLELMARLLKKGGADLLEGRLREQGLFEVPNVSECSSSILSFLRKSA